jgi:glycosyltransferase involved in cell wall biosynthesis
MASFKLLFAKFDVIDVDHMPYFPLFSIRIVAWLKRKPMIATWHEVWGRDYWRTYMGASGNIAYAIERLSILLPSKIIAVSEMTGERLRSEMNFKRSTPLVRNGVDMAAIKRVHAKTTHVDVMYAGRLIEHKNVDMLLQALAKLKLTSPDITCAIFGDGPERSKLEALSQKLGLTNNVKFYGFLKDHSQVYAYMKAARVFVLPSTREGFGISVIEANACGLPVVTMNHPANAAKDLITPITGRLAKTTALDLAKQIQIVLNATPNPKAVRNAVAVYDWQASTQELKAVYAS